MKNGFIGAAIVLAIGVTGLVAQPRAQLGAPVPTVEKTPAKPAETGVKADPGLRTGGEPQPRIWAGPDARLGPPVPTVRNGPEKRTATLAAVEDVAKKTTEASGTKDRVPQPAAHAGGRLWGGAEYLLWRLKSSPVSVPLITINDDPASIAALNEPGTRVLFGAGSGERTNLDWFGGMRFTLGGWADADEVFGLEASGFLLERRNLIFSAASAGGANPVVSIPANSVVPFLGNPAGETSQNSAGFPNRISAHLNTRMWGMEANGILDLYSNKCARITAILGFRYFDLLEHLSLTDTIDDAGTGGLLFLRDDFGTRNQFYGGQIGTHAAWMRGRWQVDATAKIAFGSTHQTMDLDGETTVTNGAIGFPTGTIRQGTFVEASNRGRHNRNVFAVVPEVQVNVGYQLTKNIRPFLGYNWMYLSNAARPGNQVDRNINPTQQPFFVPPGTLTGPAAPLANFRSGDFWAQGFNLGVEVRY